METVTKKSIECLGISPNRHNRIYLEAHPLNGDQIEILREKSNDLKVISKLMVTIVY